MELQKLGKSNKVADFEKKFHKSILCDQFSYFFAVMSTLKKENEENYNETELYNNDPSNSNAVSKR